MKSLKPSTQYKKDLKRIRNNPKKAQALLEVLYLLEQELEIPQEYNPHMLTGDYNGCMECHIQGDFLLIWIDEDVAEIDLVRLGSHSELFGKGVKRYKNSLKILQILLKYSHITMVVTMADFLNLRVLAVSSASGSLSECAFRSVKGGDCPASEGY